MDAESEKIAPPNNGSGESTDPAVLKEKVAEELKSAASLKGGGGEDNVPESVPIEKDDLLERLEKIETSPPAAPAKESDGSAATANANDVDMENDDLIQRLEAMEKGEAEETAAKEDDKKDEPPAAAEVSHQNGLEKSGEAEPLVEEKMEVDAAAVAADKKDDVSSSDSAAAPETTANGSSADHDKEEQQPTSSAKRRHSEDEELEPSSKKVHVEEETSKAETVAESEEKKEEPIADKVEEEKSAESEATPEPASSVVEEPKAEEKIPVEEEPPKEPESETVDSKPKDEEEVQEKPTEQEKPLEDSAPPPEPDPVQEPAAESAPEEKKEESVPVVEEQEQSKSEDAKEDVKTVVDDKPEAEVVVEKPEVAVESTDKPEAVAEKVGDPVEETKEDEVASTETVEPASAPAEESAPKVEESKPEPSEATLPDTEPTTDVESQEEQQPSSSSPEVKEKTDDAISSSSEPKEPLASAEVVEKKGTETETVTSSDEKPAPEPEVVQSAAVVEPAEAPQVDEAMEVDSEPVVEKSNAEVSEAPCAKKEAYLCTEKKVEEPESAPVVEGEPEKVAAADAEEEQMEVDSAAAAVAVAPSQSKSEADDVTEGMNTSSEELIKSLAKADDEENVADSQSETEASTVVSALDKNVDAEEVPPATAADQSKPAEDSKVLDETIECPTSSSDKMADRLKQRLDLISNGSSTPNAAVSSSNVYNSTPIQKQFEISSENVSKITRPSVDNSRQEEDEEHSAIVADNSVAVDEKEAVAVASTSGVSREPESKKDAAPETSKETASSVKEESSLKSSETSEVDSCTASSALNTAEEANLYASNARKFNGISSTSGSELDDKSAVATPASNVQTTAATTTTSTTVNKLDLTPALTSEEALYEVSVWFDGVDLQFLSVEKVVEHKLAAPGASTGGSTQDLTGIDSSKQSSNGSVASLGPFPLPPARPTADSGMSHSSTTDSSGTATSQFKTSLPKMKQTVRGAKALASLMIQEFQKIKRALSADDELSDTELDQSNLKTPKTAGKKAAVGRGHKRTHTESEADEEPKSKQAASKSAKKQKASTPVPAEAEPAENQDDWLCCLARWSDRKYYAGKVTGYKGDNKYMVLFEDGASKALSKDVIVIGDKDTLPIVGHAVHALTGGDTYEPGFVEEVKRNDANEVLYVVRIGDGTVEVTASDMYLNEEQAKYINKACKAAETAAATTGDDPMQSPSASGKRGSATNTPILQTPDDPVTSGEKGSRSTRSKRGGGGDKPQTPVTPEAGYSGGVGKKGRRGRRLS